MSSSYCILHPASHKTLIDISDAWAITGTSCARFASSGMPAMSRLLGCVGFSFVPSGRLIEKGVPDGCTFFTGVPGRTKCLVAPVPDMASSLDRYISSVEYAVSNYL